VQRLQGGASAAEGDSIPIQNDQGTRYEKRNAKNQMSKEEEENNQQITNHNPRSVAKPVKAEGGGGVNTKGNRQEKTIGSLRVKKGEKTEKFPKNGGGRTLKKRGEKNWVTPPIPSGKESIKRTAKSGERKILQKELVIKAEGRVLLR